MKKLEMVLENKYKLILLAIFLIALLLRWLYLPHNAVSFAYDQARDAFIAQELINGDLKIQGPPVSGVAGLFHGVLYYYVIAPLYLIGHGNPVVVAYFLSFFNALTVFLVYWLTILLSKSKSASVVAALLFAVSFESTQYANLLTNASMAIWFVPIAYIGLYLWITKTSKWGPVIAALGLGFSLQSEIALGFHFAPFAFWLYIARRNVKVRDVLKFVVVFLLATASFIVSEIKFGFPAIAGLSYLLGAKDEIASANEFGDFLVLYLNQLGKTLSFNLFPINIRLGGLLGFSALAYALFVRKKSADRGAVNWSFFLATIIMAHIVALPFGGTNMRHIMVGASAAIASFFGIFIWRYLRSHTAIVVGLLLLIIAANVGQIIKENKNGQTIFPHQLDLVLSKEMELVDYTYNKSQGADFSINSLTNPLYINTLWSYLYNWYGFSKYDRLPYWTGRDQIDLPGNNLLFPSTKVAKHFFIIEPLYGIPELFVGYGLGEEEATSTLVSQVEYGELVVQEREKL